MRGDASVEQMAAAETVASTASTAEIAASSADAPPISASSATPTDSVDSRLGLDPAGPAEEQVSDEKVERPRFLEISDTPAEVKADVEPAGPGTSTIVGPSFLGLSDAPQIDEEASDESEAAEPARSHARLWLAAAVVALFAILGVMQWRAQLNQTGNGPVDVVRMKLRNWKRGGAAQSSGEATPVAANDSNAKPEMQVAEQAKPPPHKIRRARPAARLPARPIQAPGRAFRRRAFRNRQIQM